MAASWASSPAARVSMLGNRSRDTKPELAVRRLVHAAGLRYRVCARPLPELRRTADLVFPRARVAVFVDGCYWHGRASHGRAPKANAAYWSQKITRNRERDAHTNAALEAAGWMVLRFWEHQDPASVALAVEQAVKARRA